MKNCNGFRRPIGPSRVLPALVLALTPLLLPDHSAAEERKFIVMLAHSPKQAGTVVTPQEVTPDAVDTAFFGEDDISFKRFWEEISYNSVTIDGDVFGYVMLPWPLEPPSDVLDEGNENGLFTDGTIPYTDLNRSRSFTYGVGEHFSESQQMFEVDWDGNFNGFTDATPPVPAPDDDDGEDPDFVQFGGNPPYTFGVSSRKFGLVDGVWTPGERWRDVDTDGRWDYAEVGPDDGGICPSIPEFYDPTTVSSFAQADETSRRVEDCLTGQTEGCGCINADNDDLYDPGEPWEDFMVRYDPTQPEGSRWVPVTEDYVRKNYPGDVEALIARMGNFTWDGPDSWTETIAEEEPGENLTPEATTKLQHGGRSITGQEHTPRPPWLTAMWLDRYGTTPPAWGDIVTGDFIPDIRPFDPAEPDPEIDSSLTEEEIRRAFRPGTYNPELKSFDFFSYNPDLADPNSAEIPPDSLYSPRDADVNDEGDIQYDATGVYDGPVEFDDLAKSIYHDPPDVRNRRRFSCGDMRLGEVTSPSITATGDVNNPDDLDPVWGEDFCGYDPYEPAIGGCGGGDNVIWSSGPYAFRTHGNNQMDAGNQLSIELLTWRTDGQGTTLPKDSKLPNSPFGGVRAIWNEPTPIPFNMGRTYREVYLGSTESFSDFDGSGGFSLAEACDDLAAFEDTGMGFGISGLTMFDGEFYLANANTAVISQMGPVVIPSADDLPCLNPVLDPTPLADTTAIGMLSAIGFTDIQAIEFDGNETFYAINADTDELLIATNALTDPVVEIVTLRSRDAGQINNSQIYVTGLAYDSANDILYASDTQSGMLLSIGTEGASKGEWDWPINNVRALYEAQFGTLGEISGIAYRPADGLIWGVADGGGEGSPVSRTQIFTMDPVARVVARQVTRNPWSTYQYHDIAIDENSDLFFVEVATATMDKFRAPAWGGIGWEFVAELAGPGVCLCPTGACTEDLQPTGTPNDSDGDGVWDRRDEPYCDDTDNGRFDFAGFRDFTLDGLIDQGETIVPNGMNYMNDPFPSTTNNSVFGIYPFNRRRLLEDVVQVNDHQRDWTDYVVGAQLPNNVYSTTLVTPSEDNSAFGDIREHAPGLWQINTLDQAEPFDNLILNDRNVVEFDGGESYTDTNTSGSYELGEPFNDFGFDGIDGTGDGGEGNGTLDGEPYIDVNGNGKRDFGGYIDATDLVGPVRPDLSVRVTAHEYGHFWEWWPDLYDLVAADMGSPLTGPVSAWDLMATGGTVHPSPMLKAADGGVIQHQPWIDITDLTTALTPGIEQTVTINTCELSRQNAYYVYTNMDVPTERFYFWRVTNSLLMPDGVPSVNTQLPGAGLLVMHVDTTICPGGGLCPQQPEPWVYKLVQADGRNELQDGGNTGDQGDPFGFGDPEFPPVLIWEPTRSDNQWGNGAVTGIEITNIQHLGTASLVTFRWTPQDVPWFSFIRPPGGESSGPDYDIAYTISDRFGGTLTEFYVDGPYDPTDAPVDYTGGNIQQLCAFLNPDGRPTGPAVCPAGSNQIPKPVGTFDSTFPVDLSTMADGDYFFFARLVPGEGQGGNFEQAASVARPPRDADGNANTGDGVLTGTDDGNPSDQNITPPVVDINLSLLETWTVVCNDATTPGAEIWGVSGTLSGPQGNVATTNADYSTDDGAVSFHVANGAANFAVGDRFIFTTTGKTAFSARLRVNNNTVSINPTASFTASPLTGGAPLTVTFNAGESFDPESGGNTTLDATWNFGDPLDNTCVKCSDGQAIDCSSVPIANDVCHQYTQAGTFNVTLTVTSQVSDLDNLNPTQTTIEVTSNEPPIPCIEDTDPQGSDFGGNTNETPNGFVLSVQAVPCAGNSDIDPNDDPLLADWDFGDPFDDPGDPDMVDVDINQVVTHTYRAAGVYTLTLTAREDTANEGQGVKTQDITVTGNGAPTAVISAAPLAGLTPLDVTFNGSGSSDPDAGDSIVRYDWDYGDSAGTCDDCGPTPPVYQYVDQAPAAGFTAELTVTDVLGVSNTASIQVFAGNALPTAAILTTPSPANVSQQETVTFQAVANDPNAGDVLSYKWDFEAADGVDLNNPDATGAVVTHAYANLGAHTVTLTVDDGRAGTATETVVVTVTQNDPPVAVLAASPTSGAPPLEVSFSAVGSSDRETGLAALLFTWDFGDGQPPTAGFGLLSVRHTYNAAAAYRASVTVSDGVLSRSASVDINVRIPPPSSPTAVLSADPTSGAGPLTVRFDASLTSDPDDDLGTFLWEFGDGAIARESLATVTSLMHTYDGPGTYMARLTAFDMQGRSSVATVEITVGEGEAGAPAPAFPCGFGIVETLSMSLIGLMGMRLRARRRMRRR